MWITLMFRKGMLVLAHQKSVLTNEQPAYQYNIFTIKYPYYSILGLSYNNK